MKLINSKITTLILSTAAILALSGCGSEGIPSERGLSGTPAVTPPPTVTPPVDVNTPPVANAGVDQKVITAATVQLDGSLSSDADGDTLTYAWSIAQKPTGSTATLTNASSANPTLLADVDGSYSIGLEVSDGFSENADTVSINAYTVSGITIFNQTVPIEDDDGGVFPGQANYWDLDDDGSLDDGYNDQFDGALEIVVNGDYFPEDQTYTDLTYAGPLFGSSDGMKVAALTDSDDFNEALNGNFSVMLNKTSKSQISQDIDLSTATGAITLLFSYDADPEYYYIDGRDYYFSVIIIESDGTKNETKIVENTSDSDTDYTIDLSAYAGKNIKLVFNYSSDDEYGILDDISIKDGSSTEFVVNGDFEGGTLANWTPNEPVEPQNVTFGSRDVSGVDVVRSFYTKPDSLWGRWVDVYENNTGTAVDINVTYETNLGSDDCGIIYYTPDTSNKALTTWDGDNSDRDIGFVFGNASLVEFESDDGLCKDGNGDNGSDGIDVYYNNITIPANGKISIVNFILMNGKDTADTATDINAKATEIDVAAKAIVDGMSAGTAEYFEGMTTEQKSSIINF